MVLDTEYSYFVLVWTVDLDKLSNVHLVGALETNLSWKCVNFNDRGLVATFQAFQKGLGAFLATRLILGFVTSNVNIPHWSID